MPPVTDEIQSLEARLSEEQKSRDDLIESIKGEGSEEVPFEMEPGHLETFQKSLSTSKEIENQVAALKGHGDAAEFLKSLHGEPMTEPAAIAAAVTEALKGATPAEVRSIGAQFTESDEFKELVASGGYTMARPFQFKGDLAGQWDRLQRKDVYSDLPSGTPGGFGTVERDPLVPRPQRQVRVRSLFPVRRTNAAVIEFFRVTGFTNAASPVPERTSGAFSAKPQSGLTFEGEQAATRTIAHWEAAHRNVLADEPQLQGIVENELLYGLRLVEDDQILNGTGTGEDLLGILNTSGVQDYNWSDGAVLPVPDNKADAVRRAATKALLALYEPTGVVVHDSDWEDIELTKNAQGDYLLAISIALGGEPRVWRMPVVSTPAIDPGRALVGAFGIGSQLYDREDSNIRISEHHSDFFVRNAVVILAEQRLALATKRPEAFVNVDFDAEPEA